MQNSCLDMELEEDWELLPDPNKSFLDFGHGSTKNNLLLKELIVDMDYFICPLTEQDAEREHPASSKQALRSSESAQDDESEDKFFKDIGVVLPPPVILVSPHHDAPTQVLFKKLCADMKVADSSPRSNAGWGGAIAAHFSGDDEEAAASVEDPPLPEKEETEEAIQKEACGSTAWRWRLAGIGAFCSMGAAAAAATFCILVFGGGRPQQKRRIQFSICADEKTMKGVVQQAARLNQALLTVSGATAPMARADISFGGYYASA